MAEQRTEEPLGDGVAAALAWLLDADPSLRSDPERMRRGLADLVPDQDRAADLLVRSVELGAVDALSSGHAWEARALLVDRGGVRSDLASEAIAVWEAVQGPGPVARSQSELLDEHEPPAGRLTQVRVPTLTSSVSTASAANGEVPFGATIVSTGLCASGALAIAVGTPDGLFAAALADGALTPWRRLASPSSPMSRAVCLVSTPQGHLWAIWSSERGIERRQLEVDRTENLAGQFETVLSMTDPTVLFRPGAGQPRYPLAASWSDREILDLFWTTDRQSLFRTSIRGTERLLDPAELPRPVRPPERLVALEVLPRDERDLVLAAMTDSHRILVTEWDITLDVVLTWRSVAAPVSNISDITLLHGTEGVQLLAALPDNRCFSVTVRETLSESWPWRQVAAPEGMPPGNSTRAIAAAPPEAQVMVAAGSTGVFLIDVAHQDPGFRLGRATCLVESAS